MYPIMSPLSMPYTLWVTTVPELDELRTTFRLKLHGVVHHCIAAIGVLSDWRNKLSLSNGKPFMHLVEIIRAIFTAHMGNITQISCSL